MNLLFTLYAHLYFVVYDERIHQRAASARIETEHQRFSHDSFERLWLIIAFISSTEPRVIVYNAQHCKNAIEFSSWWRAALNVLITLVCILNIKTILFGHFFFWSLGSCIQNPLGSKIWGATAEIAFREERYFGWVPLWLSAPSTWPVHQCVNPSLKLWRYRV